MQQNNKKNKFMIMIITLSIILVGALATYSFTFIAASSQKQTASLSTGSMFLVFSDGDSMGINKSLLFNESVTKKFTIENRGTVASSLSLDWENLINTYLYGSLSYVLNRVDASGNVVESIITKTNMPVSNTAINQSIASELSVPAGETYYYDLVITLNNLPDVEQSSDLSANFQTTFRVGQPSKYRYYDLVVKANEGSWGGSTGDKISLLKHGQTANLVRPTRDGYTFDKWTVKGTGSSISAEDTFTMGISDTYVIAEWTPNPYTLTINYGYEGTINTVVNGVMDGTVTFDEPTREGYTFTGWSIPEGAKGSLISNSSYKLGSGSVTITATWQINNYKYIVYHYKQNVLMNGYFIEDTDTDIDSGQVAEYNTTVRPPVRSNSTGSFQGFNQPEVKDLLIRAEYLDGDSNTPVLNKVDYEYDRLPYTLTINKDGGTGGSDTQTVYYGTTTETLVGPTKPGYNFNEWIKVSGNGTITDGKFTMGLGGAEIKATYTLVEYTVTFNANGGVTDPLSKTVTYTSTYGTLPTPTSTNRNLSFQGWFTESVGGDQVTSDTQVTTTTDQILYAHWSFTPSIGVEATLIALNKTPAETNLTSWGSIATTDETADGLFWMEDDYGTSYYYRGAVEDNYVQFGKNSNNQDLYWRIIRVNGDGSLRIIYDGTSLVANANGSTNYSHPERFTHREKYYATSGGAYKDAKYVGYMYGPEDVDYTTSVTMKNGKTVKYSTATQSSDTDFSQITRSTSAKEAQTNTMSSYAKYLIEKWYEDNLDTNYGKYLSDEIFCVDRTTPPNGTTWLATYQASYANLGYGVNVTPYGAYSRFMKINDSSNANPVPTFICSNNNTVSLNNDKFTVKDTTNGNGALTYPIGLITADEINASGSGMWGIENRYYYLYKSSNHYLWSLSPYRMDSFTASTFGITNTGAFIYVGVLYSPAMAPVINISPAYAASLVGEGTIESPFMLPDAMPTNFHVVTFMNEGVEHSTKVVKEGDAYGELPIPEKDGYRFVGWFTAATGGTHITNSSIANITSNQTLYAQWKEKWSVTDIVTAIVNHQTPSKGVADTNITLWNSVETTDATIDGLYTAEDDYGTSYYYRGAVSNNYVQFGKNSSNQDLYWRIIRVNGDGSVRMIYDGTSLVENAGGATSYSHPERFTHLNKHFSSEGLAYSDAKYVGYMYGPEDNGYMASVTMVNGETVMYSTATQSSDTDFSQITNSEHVEDAQKNEVSSYAKYLIEKWYEDNLKNDYGEYLSDEIFCVDRTIMNNKDGFGTSNTYYGLYGRYFTNKTNVAPTFECTTNNIVSANNDKFTVSDTTNGNGDLAYPIGLITANEIVGAGGVSEVENRYYYLYKSSSHNYYSLSPLGIVHLIAGVHYVGTNGKLGNGWVKSDAISISPVINLSPTYAAQLLGDGTIEAPYVLPEGVQ